MREPRLVRLHGQAGIGRTRLMSWICERALEVGAGVVLRSINSPIPSASHGLPGMLAKHIGSHGLPRSEQLGRIESVLRGYGATEPYEWEGMFEFLSPNRVADGLVHFRGFSEWYALVCRHLARIAGDRVVILSIDDAQWAADDLLFVHHVMTAAEIESVPVLFLVATQDEGLRERQLEATLVSELAAVDGTVDLELGPLSNAESRELLGGLLGLSGALAREVECRCAGNPLFAIQLVADWVEREVLKVGRHGFELSSDEAGLVPDNIHAMWTERLNALFGQLEVGGASFRALEAAAALGMHVEMGEWRSLCGKLGVRPIPGFITLLATKGLAERTETGWVFANAMLRESLKRRAMEGGRWRLFNSHSAAVILEGPASERSEERLAQHLLEAEAYEDAIEPLMTAVGERLGSFELRASETLMQGLEHALAALSTSERRAEQIIRTKLLRASLCRLQGHPEEALTKGQQAVSDADGDEHAGLRAKGLEMMGLCYVDLGEGRTGAGLFTKAATLGGADQQFVANQRLNLVLALLQLGELESARRALTDSISATADLDDLLLRAKLETLLGRLERKSGALDKAASAYAKARELYSAGGYRTGIATAEIGLAEVERDAGNLSDAEARYQAASEILRSVGSPDVHVVGINLGLILVARRQFAKARRTLLGSLQYFSRRGRQAFEAIVHVALLPCAAGLEEWESWDYHMRSAVPFLDSTRVVDNDIAWPAQLAGELAVGLSQRERARGAYQIAQEQWLSLGNKDKVAEVRRLLKGVA